MKELLKLYLQVPGICKNSISPAIESSICFLHSRCQQLKWNSATNRSQKRKIRGCWWRKCFWSV